MKQHAAYKWLISIIVLLVGLFVLSACGQGTATPTPGATPAPTSTPQPRPTYQAQDFGVTWSSSWYAHTYEHNPPQQLAVDAGASWDRWAFEWNRIMDPRDGTTPPVWAEVWAAHPNPSLQEYSYHVAQVNAQGTTPPLQVLGVFNNLISDRSAISYDSGGTWEAFVRAVVDEYDDVVAAWEVGNEFGFMHEVPGENPPVTPEDYVKALAVVCQIVGDDANQLFWVVQSPKWVSLWQLKDTTMVNPIRSPTICQQDGRLTGVF